MLIGESIYLKIRFQEIDLNTGHPLNKQDMIQKLTTIRARIQNSKTQSQHGNEVKG